MRAGWVLVAAVLAALSDRASADDAPLPGGEDVSRPLTPVEVPPPPAPEPVRRVEELRRPPRVRRGPLGPSWYDLQYLLWWPKAHPLPPLVTAAGGGSPVLGDPDTVLLVGGRAVGTPAVSGGRFALGCSVDDAETRGAELVYFFLGTRTVRAAVAAGDPRVRAVGLPYVSARTGDEDVFPLPPGSAVTVATTTRVQGVEANTVASLFDRDGLRVNGLVGYRFLQVHEGLAITQVRPGAVYDEFAAHNRFHGGQLGLHADWSRGVAFCELTGKVALGGTFEVVRVDGATAGGGFAPGGLYTGPTNFGRFTREAFAVVPEGTLKFGLRWGDAGRVYVGYNFLYLSDAVRPGEQLDRVLNPANVPALGAAPGFAPPDRPRPVFHRSEFWAQGLIFGLEARY